MIRIVTDSSSDLSPHLAAELGVTVIPTRISFGPKVYRDGVDINQGDLPHHLTKGIVPPTIEPPTIEEFQTVYDRLLKGTADEILSIHASSRLNRTVHVAREAAKSFLGRNKITIVDSRQISWGLELLVDIAVEAVQRGEPVHEIVRLIRGVIPHIYMVFFTDNLEYLERQTRPGRGRLLADNVPGLRPLLIMEEGEIVPLERVRARGKSVDRLFEFVSEFAYFDRVCVLQGRLIDEAVSLFERLREVFPEKKLHTQLYGPTLAAYLGLDALGVGVYEGL